MTEATKKLFRFFTNDRELIDFLNSKKEISAFLINTLNEFRTGKLIKFEDKEVISAIKQEELLYKKKRNENLDYRNRIDKVRAVWYEGSDKPPSEKIENVIRKGVQERQNSFQEIANIVSHYQYVEKNKTTGEMEFFCKHCANKLWSKEEDMIKEMTRHVQAMHASELLKIG